MPHYTKKPRALSDLIQSYIDNFPRKRELRRGMALSLIPKMAGEQMGKQIKGARFRGDKLCLTVPNQIWRQEIHYHRHQLKKKLNHEIGEEVISDIIVYGE